MTCRDLYGLQRCLVIAAIGASAETNAASKTAALASAGLMCWELYCHDPNPCDPSDAS